MPALALAIDLNEDCGINDRFISERGRSKTEWRPLSSVKCNLRIKTCKQQIAEAVEKAERGDDS